MKQESQKEIRKEMFDQMEADLQKTCKPEDRMFALAENLQAGRPDVCLAPR